LRIKEQETRLTLQEHDDDDEINKHIKTMNNALCKTDTKAFRKHVNIGLEYAVYILLIESITCIQTAPKLAFG